LNCVNLDKPLKKKRGYSTHDTIGLLATDFVDKWRSSEIVGDKTMAAIESDFLSTFNKDHPQGRPEGGLTIEEMAKAANVDHTTIRRWITKQKGYKAILGTKQYATRKQVVTYYVKQ
jgi:hypothetical protein